MGSSVFIGLAVTSHSNVFNSTATIDHVNLPPIANAGPDQSITVPANTVTLNGSATDDGQPNGSITYSWTKVSGPGTVTFGNASQAVTTAQFSAAGTYTLRLTANDGQLSATDDVVITVNPRPRAARSGSTAEGTLILIRLAKFGRRTLISPAVLPRVTPQQSPAHPIRLCINQNAMPRP